MDKIRGVLGFSEEVCHTSGFIAGGVDRIIDKDCFVSIVPLRK